MPAFSQVPESDPVGEASVLSPVHERRVDVVLLSECFGLEVGSPSLPRSLPSCVRYGLALTSALRIRSAYFVPGSLHLILFGNQIKEFISSSLNGSFVPQMLHGQCFQRSVHFSNIYLTGPPPVGYFQCFRFFSVITSKMVKPSCM